MLLLKSALMVLVVPLVVAAVVARVVRSARWGSVLGLGAGYLAGHLANALPAFPPVDVTDRVPGLALAATVLGVVEAAGAGRSRWRWAGRLLLAAATFGVILGPLLSETASTRAGLAWLGVVAVVVLASWIDLGALADGSERTARTATALVVAGGAGGVLVVSGSLVLGQLAFVLAVALTACRIAARRRPEVEASAPDGEAPVLAAVLTALVLVGHVYASVPAASAFLIAAAPAAGWVGAIGFVRRLGGWQRALVVAAAAAVPVGAALGLALQASPPLDY